MWRLPSVDKENLHAFIDILLQHWSFCLKDTTVVNEVSGLWLEMSLSCLLIVQCIGTDEQRGMHKQYDMCTLTSYGL
jgi:hypothetical protein